MNCTRETHPSTHKIIASNDIRRNKLNRVKESVNMNQTNIVSFAAVSVSTQFLPLLLPKLHKESGTAQKHKAAHGRITPFLSPSVLALTLFATTGLNFSSGLTLPLP